MPRSTRLRWRRGEEHRTNPKRDGLREFESLNTASRCSDMIDVRQLEAAVPAPKPLAGYQSYKGLPQLAGLCTVEEAAKPGLSVEECVRRLKRFHYAFKRLHEILTARITAEPIYELKTGFAHHAYLCAEHVDGAAHAHRRDARAAAGAGGRAAPGAGGVLRRDPRGADDGGAAGRRLRLALSALWTTRSSSTMADTNPLTDAPSRRVLRFARLELDDMIEFGRRQCMPRSPATPKRCASGCGSTGSPARRLLGRRPAVWTAPARQSASPSDASLLREALRLRPRPAARRALHRPVEPGRERRGVPLRRDDARRGPRR